MGEAKRTHQNPLVPKLQLGNVFALKAPLSRIELEAELPCICVPKLELGNEIGCLEVPLIRGI